MAEIITRLHKMRKLFIFSLGANYDRSCVIYSALEPKPNGNYKPLSSMDLGNRYQTSNQGHSVLQQTQIEVAADVVYDWCDGHPYLTQRLLSLIQSHPECRDVSASELPDVVSRLVTDEIVHGDDANLEYAFNYLKHDKAYQDGVFAILEQTPRQSIPLEGDLESVGFIKRSREDAYLIIRNRIYTKALKNFFAEG